MPTFCTPVFLMTSMNMSVISLGSSAGAYFRSSPGIKSYMHALLSLSLANAVSISLVVTGNQATLTSLHTCQCRVLLDLGISF